MIENESNTVLPSLRQELEILPSEAQLGGAPSWLIYDPVQAKYFQITVELFEILSLWSLQSVQAIKTAALQKFGRDLQDEDFQELMDFLNLNGLFQQEDAGSYMKMYEQAQNGKNASFGKLASSYLFFRIPLVRPDRFLQRTLHHVNFAFSRYFLILMVLVGVCGLYMVARQWDTFLNQFVYLFSPIGILFYVISLLLVKVLHELGHAYTAARYGTYVSTMGLAFMVMIPLLYTDTSDAWRVKDNRKRMNIDAAGIVVELYIAGLATFMWAFMSDGPARSAVFALATTSWVVSLFINLNPFMKFDGYYLLADSLGISNLQPRSFELSKWKLREILFDLGVDAPEPDHKNRSGMILYGFSVWIYRFFLFLGIALLVYAFFFKLLGVILFLIEIVWFIGNPIVKEIKVWWSMRDEIKTSKRTYSTGILLLVVCAAVVIPWSGVIMVPAVLESGKTHYVYSQHEGKIQSIAFNDGDNVVKDEILAVLSSPALEYERKKLENKINILNIQLSRRNVRSENKEHSIILLEQMKSTKQHLQDIEEQLTELTIKAPFDGVVRDVNPNAQNGTWVSRSLQLATLVEKNSAKVGGYLAEGFLPRVSLENEGTFIPDNPLVPSTNVYLKNLALTDSTTIELNYLASVYGGEVPVVINKENMLEPIQSIYSAQFQVLEPGATQNQAIPGVVRLKSAKESIAASMWNAVTRTIVREMGI